MTNAEPTDRPAAVAEHGTVNGMYCNTGSLLLAQLVHASSTGALATFSPVGVSPAEEVLWYALYAAVLWSIVAAVVMRFGATLTARRSGAGKLMRA